MGPASEARQSPAGGLPERAVREQLNRIVASDIFSRSERLGAFLRFVVGETLEGRGESLKEQVLAAELYGRRTGSDFPDDSAVRADARRLRDKLREYYAEFPGEPVIIGLPKGRYTPVFERNPAIPAPVLLPIPERPPCADPLPEKKRRARRVALLGGLSLAGLATALASWVAVRPAPKPEAWRPIAVSVLPGAEGAPSLSPDGNLVAFTWAGPDSERPTDIWVKAVGNETLHRLTDTPASESSPAWSPDGSQIAFVRRGEGVFVMSQLGGSERKVSDSGTRPAWTPDSQSILVRDRLGDQPAGIFQISLETLERRQVTQPSSGAGAWRFDVSPDGKTVAFIRTLRPGVDDIYVVPITGGEPERRTNWNAVMGHVLWTPDGHDLIFSIGFGYPLSLWRVPARGVRPERGSSIVLPMSANSPSISRPGPGHAARLAFLRVYHDISLRLIELDNTPSDKVMRAVRPLCDSTLVDYPGSFSPDGNTVAFTSQRGARPPNPFLDGGQLFVAGTDCSGLRQITTLPSPAVRHPAWSPDGDRIAFEATIDGNTDIYVVTAHGGQPRRLTVEPSIDRFPFWSQIAGWIYFSSDRTGHREIWRIPSTGGVAELVTRNACSEPIEAMDGKAIYCLQQSVAGAASQLKRVSLDGGEESVILERILPSHWAVTSRGIFFVSRERDFDAIDLYNPADGNVSRAGVLPFRVATIGDIGRFTVSRDGRMALTHEMERWDSDVMMIENFR